MKCHTINLCRFAYMTNFIYNNKINIFFHLLSKKLVWKRWKMQCSVKHISVCRFVQVIWANCIKLIQIQDIRNAIKIQMYDYELFILLLLQVIWCKGVIWLFILTSIFLLIIIVWLDWIELLVLFCVMVFFFLSTTIGFSLYALATDWGTMYDVCFSIIDV